MVPRPFSFVPPLFPRRQIRQASSFLAREASVLKRVMYLDGGNHQLKNRKGATIRIKEGIAVLRQSHNRVRLVKKTKLIDPLTHVMCKNVFTTEFAPRESARARRGRKEETGASTESASTMATSC